MCGQDAVEAHCPAYHYWLLPTAKPENEPAPPSAGTDGPPGKRHRFASDCRELARLFLNDSGFASKTTVYDMGEMIRKQIEHWILEATREPLPESDTPDSIRRALSSDAKAVVKIADGLWKANQLTGVQKAGFFVGVAAVFASIADYVTVPANAPAAAEEHTPEAKK